jgi:hypothetical protein
MSAWDDADVGYDQNWAAPQGSPNVEYAGQDPSTNPAGAADDPFNYTKGSLLTPWEGKFSWQGGNGGSGVADYKPFGYADFNYAAKAPEAFKEVYENPGKFAYNDYTGPEAFRSTTAADMEADPGYQARMDAGRRNLEAGAAHTGVLRTGGTLKGLQRQGSELASQEFGAVDARRKGEYAQREDQGKYSYGTNRANASENFDRNVKNEQTGYGLRQGAWRDNADVALRGNQQGFDFYAGGYDRNFSKARQGYEDQAAHDQAVASAGAAGSSRDYNRALDEYKMSRDEFYTNQDRQYNILDREDTKGRDATFRQADAEYRYGADMSGNSYDRANAAADGRAAQGQASASMWAGVGNTAMDAAMYAYSQRRPGTPAPPRGAVPSIGYRRPGASAGQ